MDNLNRPKKGDMAVISKKEALSFGCPDCTEFLELHKVVKEPAVYIGGKAVCRKCKLQFDMMGDSITRIWRIF